MRSSQPKQLAGEQGEDRTQDGAGNLASRQNSDHELDLYTPEDGDETRAAQGEYLMALGVSTNTVQ